MLKFTFEEESLLKSILENKVNTKQELLDKIKQIKPFDDIIKNDVNSLRDSLIVKINNLRDEELAYLFEYRFNDEIDNGLVDYCQNEIPNE
jgi:hypothetical protein